jgi:hypothetical protein
MIKDVSIHQIIGLMLGMMVSGVSAAWITHAMTPAQVAPHACQLTV